MFRKTIDHPFRKIATFYVNHSKHNLQKHHIKPDTFITNRKILSIKNTNLKYGYFTLVDKPIQSATLNSIIELGA